MGRRWQTYALRSLTLLGILLAMAVVQSLRVVPPGASMGFKGNAALGAQLFEVFAIAEMILVLFVAPGMSAGILIPERNRGTLFHVLMTDLSAPEIVLAKYAGRVVPILALLAAAFPLTAILVLLGGIDPLRVIALAMLLAAYAILIPATFLLLSLFLKRVADLLSLGYLIISLWSVLPIIGGWGARLPDPFGRFINDYSPFYLVSYVAGFGPTTGFGGVVEFLVASIALAAFCLAFVAARLRAMTVAEADRGAERKPRRWRLLRAVRGREPDLDARPILWLEWARNRRGLALWLYRLTLFVGVGIADIWLLTNLYDANTPARVPSVLVLAVTLPVSHLLVLVGLAGQFAEDRQNRHFEMLGVTNLEPREILRDRSASASRLCVVAAILASTYTALLMAPEPALGFAATLMMATTAYCLARFSVSLGQCSALRFEKPWTGVVCGVAVLAFLNFAFFLMAMVLGPGG
ncbi:MAG TPA: hypothetical protein VNC50_07000, partial [Planctomycetia bacterium]|nr:hypothetical protein [Planctomycetia bacterium]